LVHGVDVGRAREDLVEGRLAVPGRRRRLREGDVLVEWRVLVARRRLHRGDDLAGDAELGEVAEARLTVRAVVAHGLVEPDEPFLDQVVGVAADQEVRRRLQADEAVVAPDDHVVGVRTALLGESDQIVIVKLSFSVTSMRLRTGGADCHRPSPWDPQMPGGIRSCLPPLAAPFQLFSALKLRSSLTSTGFSGRYGALSTLHTKLQDSVHERGGR